MKTIVQVGAHTGKDHVFDYINHINDEVFGIFVEANSYSIPILKNVYNFLDKKIISNIAISNYDGKIKFYLPPWYKSGDAETGSVYKIHTAAHLTFAHPVQEIEVTCLTLNTYLNNVLGFDNNNEINNLFIDAEGHDCDILISTDFSKLNIKQICFEFIHTDGVGSGMETEKMRKTNEHLIKNGFKLKEILHSQHNIIYENV